MDTAASENGTVERESALERARAGDEAAFRELTDPFRRELEAHCYRLLGSVQDAEDLVQETLLAAWRGLERFEGRASVRTWLHRIATNRCLNALRDRSRRPLEVPPLPDPPAPTSRAEPLFLEPYPDARLEDFPDRDAGPAARHEARERIGLAYVAALQGLPPRQRAALVLSDVLDFRNAEVASILETSPASVKGALQRARAAVGDGLPARGPDRVPAPDSPAERRVVRRFADAVESGDVDEVVALLTDDALLTMPPQPHVYRGRAPVGAFLRYAADRRGAPLRVVLTRANGQPALACYLPDAGSGAAHPYGMIVLTLAAEAVGAITWFSDPEVLARFGLPSLIPAAGHPRASGRP